MDLNGEWAAAEADDDLRRSFPRPELDDCQWQTVTVPGHWQAEPAFANSDGPLLFRRHFGLGAPPAGRRAWLVMDGIFYQSDVWLDGSYMGDTEGYFFAHEFDVTSALEARSEHLLAVEVGCERPAPGSVRRALTGIWGQGDCVDPAYNPGGIWAPVRVVESGPVHIRSFRAACAEASPRRAVLDLFAVLDSAERLTVTLRTQARRTGDDQPVAEVGTQQPLAVGINRVRWRLEVPRPELWWPAGLGEQPLYDLEAGVEIQGEHSDARALRTGLRQVRMREFGWSVNGERIFLKGANLAPTRRDLAYATPQAVARDVDLARQAGLNLLRVRAHIGRRELYDAADESGMLLWQDMPLLGTYKGVRRQAVRQASAAVGSLGHHPSIIVWCGHSEPFAPAATVAGMKRSHRALRWTARQVLPTPNKSLLDRSIRRALERADPSRPAVAHSGVLPHPAWGTGSHLYFGWYYGRASDLSRVASGWPSAVRFVSEFGAQAVPTSASFMEPERWPDLDWERLVAHHCMQKAIFDERVPPLGYDDFGAWRQATQDYQAHLVRFQVETLRRLRDQLTGGFAVACLNDSQPAVSHSMLDSERIPKAAFAALQAACSPVLVAADWPAPSYRPGTRASFAVHVVNDTREDLVGAVLDARLSWPGGGRRWRLGGEAGACACSFVGRVATVLPQRDELVRARPAALVPGAGGLDAAVPVAGWPLNLDLELSWGEPGHSVANRYSSAIVA